MSSTRPCLAFACAHLTDERLYAPQLAALGDAFDCRVFVFRDDDTLAGMAGKLLAGTPPRFSLVGLSLGGYVAFEVVRQQPGRLERLALLDTRASADAESQRAGRQADIEKVRAGGIEALIPELPGRWLLPAHAARADLVALMADMAKSVGARGQRNQQRAMLARPDSHADLERLRLPALVLCGEQDAVTPIAGHEAMAACLAGSRLEVVPECGHLSTIEQPEAVSRILADWLASTG
ncbi:MAG: alpha/beta hydrolase [Burkholderiales bacterium]|nr:alpha/beta hydrolase [Burkholderiales bacterium]